MGDPAGIGPEVVVKALADPDVRRSAKFIIFGMHEQLAYAADKAEIEPFWGRYQHEKITTDVPCKVVVADAAPRHINTFVLSPAALPLISLSKPIAAPNMTAKIMPSTSPGQSITLPFD